MADPGQCPAGRRVTVKLRAGQSGEGSSAMETGCSMGSPFKNGANWVKLGSLRSSERVTSEQYRLLFLEISKEIYVLSYFPFYYIL